MEKENQDLKDLVSKLETVPGNVTICDVNGAHCIGGELPSPQTPQGQQRPESPGRQ